MLAVSGTHVTYVILFSSFFINKIFGRKISNLFSILVIIFFVILTGGSASVLRSGIMAIILIISNLLSRRPDTLSSISISALIILLINPYSICDTGFILSFGGTIGIVLLNRRITENISMLLKKYKDSAIKKFFVSTISVSISAQLVLAPIMCLFFNKISIVAILTNLIISPIFGIAIILGLLLSILSFLYFPLIELLGYFTYVVIHAMIVISNFLGSLPFANIEVLTPSLILVIVYYLFLFKIFNNKKDLLKIYNYDFINLIMILLGIIFLFHNVIPKNYVEVNFIDVDQGDACHIKTSKGYNILIDSGGSESSDYDVGENILIPYLLDNTNGVIDTIFISHFHEDHSEGIISLLKRINYNSPLKVNNIIIGVQPQETLLYDELLKICKEKNIKITVFKKMDKYSLDGVLITALYPTQKIDINDDLNNNSLILKCSIYGKDILFTGDAEKEEEKVLLDYYNNKSEWLDVDILKVGHHGSKTSSTEELLKAVTPYISIISCGADNKFGHPHAETMKKLGIYSNYILRTDEDGEIMLKIHKNGKISLQTMLKNY